MSKSTDRGVTWSADRGIAEMFPLPSTLPGGFRIVNLPSAAADPLTGALVVVWNDQRFGNPDIADVLLLVLVVGMAASGLLAVTVERIAYRPLRGAPRLIPLISAIGISFFLQDLIRLFNSLWHNAFNLVYPTMDALNHRFELTETIDVSVKSLVVIAAALLMLWGLHALVNRTRIGTAIRAVAEDQAAASLMGINVNRIISLTFLIGGAMGGAAGVLFGVQYGLINPYTGFVPGLKAFTAAVLGGIGNIPGAMIGGLVLGLLEAFAVLDLRHAQADVAPDLGIAVAGHSEDLARFPQQVECLQDQDQRRKDGEGPQQEHLAHVERHGPRREEIRPVHAGGLHDAIASR